MPERHRPEELEFLAQAPRLRVLIDFPFRIKAELSARLRGADRARIFLSDAEAQTVLEVASHDIAIGKLRESSRNSTSAFREREERLRKAVLALTGGQDRLGALASKPDVTLETTTLEWAHAFMVTHAEEFQLPQEQSSWPNPKSVPTLWAYTSYAAARFWLVNRDGRGLDVNDATDQMHYAAAAHCDAIVVDDRKFRAIIECCPPPKPRLLNLAEWVGELLAPRSA